jgi:predicted RNA-binding Zn-ribbon protein involved in translation (DUF1610 family)
MGANGEPTDGGPRFVAVRCASCGAGFRARKWKEGLSCPVCAAATVRAEAAPGGAVDYTVADRRGGTTAADVAFGQWAKWCGYVTPNQYNTAVHRQNSELQSAPRSRPIHEVMLALGFLDEERAIGLLRFLTLPRPNADDDDFLRRAAEGGYCDAPAAERIRALQQKMAAKRNEVPPAAQLMLQKRLVTEAQMLEVLQAQERDGVGALKAVLTMSQPPPREKALDKVTRRARESPHTIFRVILAVVLLGLVAGVWAWQAREPELVAYGKCTECGSVMALPWTATEWPARCSSCGRRTVGFAVVCPNGHVFARSSPFSREPCPQCGADYGRPLTEEEFLKLTRRRLH